MSEPIDDTDGLAPAAPVTVEEAFQRWRRPLCGYITRVAHEHGLHGSPTSAEDLVQQVFLAALSTDWAMVRCPQAWLYTVARHLVIAAAKRRDQYIADQSTDTTVTWSSMTRQASITDMYTAKEAARLVQTMPERRAKVAFLRFFLDWDYQRIATELEIDPATARVHANHARRQLEGELGSVVNYVNVGSHGTSVQGGKISNVVIHPRGSHAAPVPSWCRRALVAVIICAVLVGLYLLLRW